MTQGALTDREISKLQTPAIPAGVLEPVTRKARHTGTEQAYQTVLTFTVPDGMTLNLREISITGTPEVNAQWRVTIGGVVQFADEFLPSALTMNFPDNGLAAGTVVLVEAQSNDATEITADAEIAGALSEA